MGVPLPSQDSGIDLVAVKHDGARVAIQHDPVRYQDLIATSRPRAVRPTPPYVRGYPPSLERPPANRPWRIAALNWSG